jgi:hypothetical protein
MACAEAPISELDRSNQRTSQTSTESKRYLLSLAVRSSPADVEDVLLHCYKFTELVHFRLRIRRRMSSYMLITR